jgi:hypothetical protein
LSRESKFFQPDPVFDRKRILNVFHRAKFTLFFGWKQIFSAYKSTGLCLHRCNGRALTPREGSPALSKDKEKQRKANKNIDKVPESRI